MKWVPCPAHNAGHEERMRCRHCSLGGLVPVDEAIMYAITGRMTTKWMEVDQLYEAWLKDQRPAVKIDDA